MEEKLSELKVKRASAKGRITRIANYITDYDNHTNIAEVKARMENLDKVFELYDIIQGEVERLDPTSTSAHEADRKEVEDKYFLTKSLANILLEASSLHSVKLEETATPAPSEKLRLPRLDLPKFNCEMRDWPNFNQLFMAVIDGNASLSATEKLFYLKGALRGEAAGLISALAVGDGSNTKAWSILQDKYENKMVVVNYYLTNIFSFQTINRSNLKTETNK